MRVRAVSCQVTCDSIVGNLSHCRKVSLWTLSPRLEGERSPVTLAVPCSQLWKGFSFLTFPYVFVFVSLGRLVSWHAHKGPENNLRCQYSPSALWVTVVCTKPAGSQPQEILLFLPHHKNTGITHGQHRIRLYVCVLET